MVNYKKLENVLNVIRSWGFSIPIFNAFQSCYLTLKILANTNPFIGNPAFYSNNSFHILHTTHLHPKLEEAEGAEEEAAPIHVPTRTPLHQHSQLDQLVEWFDQWETRFKSYIVT
ncbi:hypothetical protein MA16_Dca026963 [Dendrobium catenatum]|uniref:Uncharacterized protein n=1 Tax=Dendrobium catenatum TaxID=906689 RepID=A0A2I0X602_9ASPA|nr:hypothetical protein MA16_Dca026963 [Dendrobium catenatum]